MKGALSATVEATNSATAIVAEVLSLAVVLLAPMTLATDTAAVEETIEDHAEELLAERGDIIAEVLAVEASADSVITEATLQVATWDVVKTTAEADPQSAEIDLEAQDIQETIHTTKTEDLKAMIKLKQEDALDQDLDLAVDLQPLVKATEVHPVLQLEMTRLIASQRLMLSIQKSRILRERLLLQWKMASLKINEQKQKHLFCMAIQFNSLHHY